MNEVSWEKIEDLLRNWKSHCNERIKSNWLFSTGRTTNPWSILPSHQVSNNWLISFHVIHPTLTSHFLFRSCSTVNGLYVGLLLNSVEILMKPINQKRKELLRIMLSIPWKHRVYGAYCWFDWIRNKHIWWLTPHALDELSICLCQLSFSSQRIGQVDFFMKQWLQEIFS